MAEVVSKIYIDWDATDWTATPDFGQDIDDITIFVQRFSISRGKSSELGNAPSGTLELVLNNSDKRFSPTIPASPLYGKIRPWLPVKLIAELGIESYTKYSGFISKIEVNPHKSVQKAYIYVTDGMDLLARQLITQDTANPETLTDGAAVGKVLDAAGWGANRTIDTDGGNVKYPICSEY